MILKILTIVCLKAEMACIEKSEYRRFIVSLQLEKGKPLRGNPGVGDVTKQYLYQLAYQDFIKAHHITEVRNCFLMPTESKKIVSKGVSKMQMLESLGLRNIQIRLIPAAELYENYLSGNHMDITKLEL